MRITYFLSQIAEVALRTSKKYISTLHLRILRCASFAYRNGCALLRCASAVPEKVPSTANRVKKFKHNLPENYSKCTKIAIAACKFSKIPRTPLELSWFLNQLQISSAEKNTLEKVWKLCPSRLKLLATPLPSLVVDEESLVIGFGPPTLEMLPPLLPDLIIGSNLFVGSEVQQFGASFLRRA